MTPQDNLICAACESEIEVGVLVAPVYRTFMSRGGRTIILTSGDDDDVMVAHFPHCPKETTTDQP